MAKCWEQRGCDEEMQGECPHAVEFIDNCPTKCAFATCDRPTYELTIDPELIFGPTSTAARRSRTAACTARSSCTNGPAAAALDARRFAVGNYCAAARRRIRDRGGSTWTTTTNELDRLRRSCATCSRRSRSRCFLLRAAPDRAAALMLEGRRSRRYDEFEDAYTPEEREVLIHKIKRAVAAATSGWSRAESRPSSARLRAGARGDRRGAGGRLVHGRSRRPMRCLRRTPNAFLLGVLFTQGIPAERAWAGPCAAARAARDARPRRTSPSNPAAVREARPAAADAPPLQGDAAPLDHRRRRGGCSSEYDGDASRHLAERRRTCSR